MSEYKISRIQKIKKVYRQKLGIGTELYMYIARKREWKLLKDIKKTINEDFYKFQ